MVREERTGEGEGGGGGEARGKECKVKGGDRTDSPFFLSILPPISPAFFSNCLH